MAFTKVKNDTYYKEVIEREEGYWDNGVFHEGKETITYKPFGGLNEPFNPDESELLPAGVKSTEARWILTSELLRVAEDYEDEYNIPDKIYLRDPTKSGRNKPRCYEVWRKESWDANDSFKLIPSGYDYIAIEEGKLK